MLSISYIIATFFGSGRLPYAPGTWGSLAALGVAFVFYFYHLQALSYLIISGILFVIGWLVTEHILKTSSDADTDPSFIVIDEVVGLFVTIGLLGLYEPVTSNLLFSSFVLFRLFDIFKPLPIGWLEECLSKSPRTAALGVMVDDVLAGVMAAGTLILLSLYS